MEEVEIKKKELDKTSKKYFIIVTICVVIGLLALGVGYYFIFAKDDNNGTNKDDVDITRLELDINGNKATYDCKTSLCKQVSLADNENYVLLKDDKFIIFDMKKNTVINTPIEKNSNITDAMVISKDNDILGFFYTIDEEKYNLYLFLDNQNYSLIYKYGIVEDNPYSLVKDGYYFARSNAVNGVVRYKDNKIMLNSGKNYADIGTSLGCYENIDGTSYYFTYDKDYGLIEIFDKNFKMVGNDKIGYKFHSYGLDNNNNFVVGSDSRNVMVVDEEGNVINNNNYDKIYDSFNGYLLVNNNNKLQLVYSDGTLIKDFSNKFKDKDINKLMMGDMDDKGVTGPLAESGNLVVAFLFIYDYELNDRYIQYEIVYDVMKKETSFREIPVYYAFD